MPESTRILFTPPPNEKIESEQVDKDLYGEAYFRGRDSNYWWTVGSYENLRRFPHWEEMLKFILRFRGTGRLLDIGCAYGFLVSAASNHFDSYGIDISRFAVEQSKKYCKENISMASAVNLPFRKGSFDVVTVVDTLEHVPHLDQCLRDVIRILKKDGILFLQFPNPLIWTHLCGRLCPGGGLKDRTHINDFGLKQWRMILAKHGLKVQKCFGMVTFASNSVWFLLKSERAASLFPELWIIAKK